MDFFWQHPLALVFSVMAAVVALAFYFNWKRRKDLEQLAASMGLPFRADGPDLEELGRTGLEIFGYGHSRKASNLIEVRLGHRLIQVFDYRYRTGGGKNSSTHNFTLALISGAGEVPFFDLKPENILHKLGEMIGFRDIDLPAFPEFSAKYRLTGPEETAVHMFFTPRRAAWFELHPGLRAQGAPGRLLLIKAGAILPVPAWPDFIEDAKVFAAEILG